MSDGLSPDLLEQLRGYIEREGLHVDWDGSTTKRISVSMEWKRRREWEPSGPDT